MISPISNFVVFDIETTGLLKDKQAIIEIACCAMDHDLNDLKEFDSGVMSLYDNREIVQQALDANGITREQIANGRDPLVVLNELCTYIKSMTKGRNKPVLVGQNSDKFDIPFLDNYFTFFGKDLSEFVNTDFTIDTMWWSRVKYKELTNFKLGTLCSENGVELTNAHRALSDTRATKDLIKIYIRSLRSAITGGSESQNVEKRYRDTFEM